MILGSRSDKKKHEKEVGDETYKFVGLRSKPTTRIGENQNYKTTE